MKFLERIAGSRRRLCQFTAIDDYTRIRVLKIYDTCNQVVAHEAGVMVAGSRCQGTLHLASEPAHPVIEPTLAARAVAS